MNIDWPSTILVGFLAGGAAIVIFVALFKLNERRKKR